MNSNTKFVGASTSASNIARTQFASSDFWKRRGDQLLLISVKLCVPDVCSRMARLHTLLWRLPARRYLPSLEFRLSCLRWFARSALPGWRRKNWIWRPPDLPIVLLVRAGAAIPHAALAQSTNDIDWKQIELRVFHTGEQSATGLFATPAGDLYQLNLSRARDGAYQLDSDPLEGRIRWQIKEANK
jgi:hypothetical protein